MAQDSILINVDVGETRVALIEDGHIAEFYVERRKDRSPVGNIYLGKVTRVLPGMQAAFVDIGLERAAFLHVEDLLPSEDPDSVTDADVPDGEGSTSSRRPKRFSRDTPIRDVVKEGEHVVVQVSKAPIGTKGARVTGHVSLPGRYVVYLPTIDHVGVSKRIGNDRERRRLKEVMQSIKPPKGGLIVRTLAQGLTKKSLKTDIAYLMHTWEEIAKKRESQKKAPALLYEDLDMIRRAARDLMVDGVSTIVIDDAEEYTRLKSFLKLFMPERAEDVELYTAPEPLFDEYGVEEEIARSLSRKIPLPSGGYLIMDQAEALTAVDVNTGRFTGKGNEVSETILQTNLEAATELAAQLRFRNIGGLIVVDFIDMEKSSHREKVSRALAEVLKKDKAKTTTERISELGLVEMTRKRTHESLGRTLHEPCFYCDGTGLVQSKHTVCHEIFRQIRRESDSIPGYKIAIHAHPAVCDVLERDEKASLDKAVALYQRRVELRPHKDYHMEQFHLSGA